ncbi:hypothetical protein IFR04_007447 [Cadophora malorum]|uniref:BZIP transcription factor n=1 Tax=Cadophora malorum TaxID=108018 RepID=A0A8H7W6I2_9HELO|nr:hypothetical protein IFR04_007447 [Cadophora malorum]
MADGQPTYPPSKEGMETGDSSISKPGAKRRASRAGTRSVASLTPEQLARKRANDREAQRSIRQRTKTHIEELEQRIRDLSQDQDARDFEQIKRRNAELEDELRHLRELLGRSDGSVASSPELTPLSSRYGMDIVEEAHPLAYSSSWSTQNIGGPGSPYSSFPTTSAGDLLSSFASDHSGLASGFSDPGSARSDTFNEADMAYNDLTSSPTAPAPISRRGAPNSRPQFGRSRSYPHGRFGVPTANAPLRMSGGINGVGSSPLAGQPISPVNRSLMMNVNGLRQPPPPTSHPLTLNQNKPRMDSSIPPQQNGTAYEMPGPMSNGIGRPAWELCLQFLPPTGPVDSILIGLLQRQRSIATQSTPSSLMTGPYHPDFRALLNPEVPNNFHPVMSIVSSLFQRIEYTGFAEKAAALFLVYHFVQWQILPTMETYHNLPDWYCPRPSQMVTAHPFWTSLAIWGRLRDVMVGDQDKYATDEFMNLYQNCICVNWPFRDEDILTYVGEELRVTDTFIRHIETQANWSLSEPFQRRYPELRDVCSFAEAPAPR